MQEIQKILVKMAKINSRGIDGPIVIHLELSTDLPTNVPIKFHHVLAS
jgi:hypothetical protein